MTDTTIYNKSDLEFVPNEELIEELFSRKTFAGIIIYSPSTHKVDDQYHENFCLSTTMDVDSATRILRNSLNELTEPLENI